MYLRSVLLSGSTELFMHGTTKKSAFVFHDESIWKAGSMDKGQKKPAKKLQFTQLAFFHQV